MTWFSRYRKWVLLAALALSVVCIIVIPYYAAPTSPADELRVRLPLFAFSCLVLAAALVIAKKRPDDRPLSPESVPEKTAIVFVHGMGVQDRYQMVGAFSTGIQLAATEYEVFEDPSQTVRVDAAPLLARKGKSGPITRIDVYEAYWGHKFNGLTRWQGTVLFGLLAFIKALPSLCTRVWRKRVFDLGFAAIGFVLVALAALTIYGGFRLTAKEISQGGTGTFITVRQRVDDMFDSISSAFKEGIAAINGNAPGVDVKAALGHLLDRPAAELVMAIVYSIAWSIMLLAAMKFAIAALGLKSYPHAHESAKALKFKEQIGALKLQALQGAAATLVYLLLDPFVGMFLVEAMLYAALLYLLIWGVKYWFTNFLGDVQIYTSTDWNSEFYKARDEAIDIVTGKIREVVDAGYSRVLVVAHSLGSAVTLIALRRLSSASGGGVPVLPKNIVGFTTIGSPLRKVRQLFRTRPYKWKYLEFNTETDRLIFGNGTNGPVWSNYWYYTDLFADRLSAIGGPSADETSFVVDTHNDHSLRSPAAIWSHSGYWEDSQFIDPMLRRLLEGSPSR
jgi:hypothetical protein